MNNLLRAASVLALGVFAYPVTASEFTFLLDGWSDGGVLAGTFEATDLNNDGQISTRNGEVTSFGATYTSSTFSTVTFSSLDAGPFGFEGPGEIGGLGLTGLVFTLDGSGKLGDDFFGDIEGLGVFGRSSGSDLGNDLFIAVGPGPFNQCTGDTVCGGLFAADDVALPVVAVANAEGPIPDQGTENLQVFAAAASTETPQTRESAPPVDQPPVETPISLIPEELALTTNTKAINVSGDIGDPNGIFESSPVLPRDVNDRGGFIFNLDDIVNLPGEIFFIDPEIAVGYTYEITGDTFAAVQAPSFLSVADNEYTLSFNDTEVTLASGELFTFNEAVTEFSITGINPGLGLQPTDTNAFVTGVAVTTGTSGATITQTPITVNAVPLPASGVLLLSGLAGIAFLRRRRKALHA